MITIAQMCKRRLKEGEPNTDYQPTHRKKREFRLPDGRVTTLENFAKFVGLAPSTVRNLMNEYDDDYQRIIDNHGFNAHPKRAPKRESK